MRRILIVEDDAPLARGLRDNLRHEGLEAEVAATGEEALARLAATPFDLVLLDLMLPGIGGFELLARLAPGPRVIVVSARDGEEDIVRALDLGAHDYVRKPFGLAELLARVRAQLRGPGAAAQEHRFGDVRIDLSRFRLWKGKQEHLLTHTKARILELFLARPNEPLRRSEILDAAWGEEAFPTERTVDNFILKLRRKLEDDPSRPRRLRTVHGVGYFLHP